MKNQLCFTTPTLDQQTISFLKDVSENGFWPYATESAFMNALINSGYLKLAGKRWGKGFLYSTVIITDKALEAIKAFNTDPSTGRAFGDDGTADQAVRFAFEQDYSHHEIGEFLEAWRNFNLSEWPEYFEWLAADDQKVA